jgi:elongation factor G
VQHVAKHTVEDVRNVALVGHGSVGKTTLLDALLHHTKMVDRRGSVDDGTSLFDVDDEEKARKVSIDSHVAHLSHKGKHFHFIDCPGYPDFSSQALAGLNHVETAVIVIDAHRGVEMNTRKMFEEAGKAGIARFIVFNKLDLDHIDFEDRLRQLRTTFGRECFPIDVPLGAGPAFKGVYSIEHEVDGVPGDAVMDAKSLREELVERVVETDDALLEKFLNGETPSVDIIISALRKAVISGRIVPVLGLSGKKDIGVEELLETLGDLAPSPADLPRTAMKGGKETTLTADPAAPLVARAFKTQADKFGNLTYLRIYQGTLHPNSNAKDSRTQNPIRLGTLQIAQSRHHEKIDEAGPGDIVCMAKLDGVEINDVLSADGAYAMPPVEFPKPMFPLAISAKARGDDLKVVQALRKLAHEDPCLVVERNDQTNETVLRGLSQLHLDIVQSRLKRRDHLELDTHAPKIPYKETIGRPGEGMFRHKKQTGGRGQFAEVHLRLKPRERGAGFEFVNSVVGGTIPTNYIPAVEKGVREQMHKGVIAGCEVVDVTVDVHFGKYHDVDSSEAAFKYAAAMAFREAFSKCQPQLLEPIVALEVVSPADKMGDINGDLNSRRAQITGMDVAPGGLQVVKANVPLSEVMQYQAQLKSMTGGQGSFAMEYSHLAPAPPQVQQQIVAKWHAEHGHKDEE